MNIVYIGSSGPLSYLPLQVLLQSDYKVSAIAVDSNKNDTNISSINTSSESLETLAFYNNLPLIKLTKNVASNVAVIKKLQADIVLISCEVSYKYLHAQ